MSINEIIKKQATMIFVRPVANHECWSRIAGQADASVSAYAINGHRPRRALSMALRRLEAAEGLAERAGGGGMPACSWHREIFAQPIVSKQCLP